MTGPAGHDGPKERTRDLGRIRLHTVEAGPADGPVVVLLHGFPEYSYGWRHQIGPLVEAGYRVVAPDGRGYGRSAKPDGIDAYRMDELVGDVLALADALGSRRIRLVGHDWGGIVAWTVAARHPERVERLAILNAPHPDAMRPFLFRHPGQLLRSWYVGLFQLPGVAERILSARNHAALASALTRTSRPGTFGPAELDGYRAAWRRPGALTGMLNWYRALIRRPSGPVGRVTAPVRILWGRRDGALLPGLAEASLAFCERGTLRPFDDATHWLQHEEADAVSAELIAFLAGSEEG